MKICFYIGSMSLGGIGKLSLHLMEEFIKKGIEVDLFLMRGDGEYMHQIPEAVRVFVEEGSYVKRIQKFISYLNKEKPDISLSARQRQDIGNILGCLFSNTQTQPVVSVHTNLSVENKINPNKNRDNLILRLFLKRLYKIPNKFIAVSQGVANDFSKRTGVPRNHVKVIYNPVYKTYDETGKEKDLIKYSKHLPKDKKFIVGVGRLTEQKDYFTLIKAYSIVRQTNDIALLILGEGGLRGEIEQQIRKMGLEEDIFLLGYVDNPQFFLKRAKLFVLSSQWEGFGNVIVEALGVGTPVVSTDCPSGPAEILEYGKYGKLVPVGDSEKMARAIEESVQEKHDKSYLIDRAKDFSTEKIANEYLEYIFDS